MDHREARRGWVLTPCAGRRCKTHSHTHTEAYTQRTDIPIHRHTDMCIYTETEDQTTHIQRDVQTEHTNAHRHDTCAYTRTPTHSLQHCRWAQQTPARVCRPASSPCPSVSAPLRQLRIRARLPEPAPSPSLALRTGRQTKGRQQTMTEHLLWARLLMGHTAKETFLNRSEPWNPLCGGHLGGKFSGYSRCKGSCPG